MLERLAAIMLVLCSTLLAPPGAGASGGCGDGCGVPAAACCSDRDETCPCCESEPEGPARRDLPNVPSPRDGMEKLVMVLARVEELVLLPRPEMRGVRTAAVSPRAPQVRVQAMLCVWRT